MIKAVLFDLDGTLADTLADLTAALNHALAAFGVAPYGPEDVKRLVGSGWDTLMSRALEGRGADPVLSAEAGRLYIDYYDAHYMDRTAAYRGIPELLDTLRQRGFRLGVVSNKRRYMSRAVTDKLFPGVFETVWGPDGTLPVKPAPDMALAAMADLGVKPSECLFVGDSDVDMYTARNAGAVPVGVLWGFRPESELREAGAAHIVARPEEVLNCTEYPKNAKF